MTETTSNTSGNGNTDTESEGQSTTPTTTTECLNIPSDVEGICDDCKANAEANNSDSENSESDDSKSEDSDSESDSTQGSTQNGFLNHCPQCNEDGKLKFEENDDSTSEKKTGTIICESCNATFCPKCGKMVTAGTGENVESSDEDSTATSDQLSPCPMQSQEVVQGVAIKDKTFEACIRRICAATDSIFIVENNAAFLFPYTAWMEVTLQQKIQQITAKEIDPDIFSFEYNNEGFYNKVTYHVGEFEEGAEPTGSVQYDALVKIYGELTKEIKTPFEDEATAKYVANSLLIAYVREFNNSCKLRALGSRKYLGGTFYAVENPFTKESEIFYLQGYTMRTQKKEPLYIDLDFRYGPEGAEELADYQPYAGGASSSGVSQSGDILDIMCEVGKIGNNGNYTHDCSDRSCFEGTGGDCIAWSYMLFDALDKHGWTVRVIYAPMGYGSHWQCQYKEKSGGDWKDLPYGEARKKCHYHKLIAGPSTDGIQIKEEFSNEGAVGSSAGKTLGG